jgi:ubiquinone/menaquinone biosynthesis C-methylase UbiE
MDYDQTTMPSAYDAGRGYAPAVLDFWLKTIAAPIATEHISSVLDLGCGTGRYSAALAAHFGTRVVGVDPSEMMLSEALRKSADNVTFLRGSGEAIPLPDATVDMVFISMVFHHFEDPRRAAEECHRVLREAGVVCMRAAVTNRADTYPYVPFFPRMQSLLASSLPSLAFIETTFGAAGFHFLHHEVVMSEVAASWQAYADKTAYRADSILAQLTDPEFEQGLTSLRRYAPLQPSSQPVIEPVDFFVYRRM